MSHYLQQLALSSALALMPWSLSYAAPVNQQAILDTVTDGAEWLSHGRTYAEQRFSPLTEITDKNTDQLNLAWSIDLANNRGLESTPLFHEGVLYATLSWSRAIAVDAKTGKILWTFDPQLDRGDARYACCDVVNRGVALWEGKVFMGDRKSTRLNSSH